MNSEGRVTGVRRGGSAGVGPSGRPEPPHVELGRRLDQLMGEIVELRREVAELRRELRDRDRRVQG
jgi:hypothetical protein